MRDQSQRCSLTLLEKTVYFWKLSLEYPIIKKKQNLLAHFPPKNKIPTKIPHLSPKTLSPPQKKRKTKFPKKYPSLKDHPIFIPERFRTWASWMPCAFSIGWLGSWLEREVDGLKVSNICVYFLFVCILVYSWFVDCLLFVVICICIYIFVLVYIFATFGVVVAFCIYSLVAAVCFKTMVL